MHMPPAAADVGCTAIPSPAATIPVNVAVTPQGTIHNFGTTAQGPFNCSLWTVGSSYHSTVRSASVPPDVTLNFDAWTPTVGGVYTLKCSTKLAGDAVPTNNASTKSILVYDALETFEASAGGYTASGGWARGTPSGGSRPTSHSGSNVWGDVLTGMYTPQRQRPPVFADSGCLREQPDRGLLPVLLP